MSAYSIYSERNLSVYFFLSDIDESYCIYSGTFSGYDSMACFNIENGNFFYLEVIIFSLSFTFYKWGSPQFLHYYT